MIKKYSHIFYWIVFSIILILGMYIRLYNLSIQSYWMDEGYTVNAINNLYNFGHTILPSGLNYNCPIYCDISAFFISIYSNEIGYRLLAVISGILLNIIVFLISKMIFDKKTAILTFIFMNFSYWQILWSRQARWYTLFSLFIWISILFYYKYLYKKNNIINIGLSLIFLILAIIVHQISYLFILIFFLWFFINKIIFTKKDKMKNVIYFVLFILAFLIIDFFIFQNGFITMFKYTSFNNNILYYFEFVFLNYHIFIIGIILGLLFMQKYINTKKIFFLLFPFLCYFIALSFFIHRIDYRYLFHTLPALFIVFSYIFCTILSKYKNKYMYFVIILIFSVFFITKQGILIPQTYYFLEHDDIRIKDRDYYAYIPQPDWKAGYQYIKNNLKEDYIVISSQPQFTNIFLNQEGYFLPFQFERIGGFRKNKEGRDMYGNSIFIDDLEFLKDIMKNNNGFIIIDTLYLDNTEIEITNYIFENSTIVFENQINHYSQLYILLFQNLAN